MSTNETALAESQEGEAISKEDEREDAYSLVPEDNNDNSNSDNSDSFNAYLTLTEEVMSGTSIAELEEAVALTKNLVLTKGAESSVRDRHVQRLIELRLRLHNLKEALKDDSGALTQPLQVRTLVVGHRFERQSHPKSLATYYCDRCSGVIWNPIHSWYLCVDCDYRCHTWCLRQVCRVCAHVFVSAEPTNKIRICPEDPKGLAAQNYRCYECLTRTQHGTPTLEPRLCDYTGQYYCPSCHWNSFSVIPARVINNWDFTERRVCRASKQQLRILANIPNLHLEKLNPILFASVDELISVKRLRKQLLLMKKYLTCCKVALESKLTWQLMDRPHFLECDDKYSLQDLLDLRSGTLLNQLTLLTNKFELHITQQCPVCHGQGYLCQLCLDPEVPSEVIFPFQSEVGCCHVCGSAYHLSCWLNYQQICPKCKRRQQRLSNSES